ncbi:hypothetical protein LCGC14_1099340 [marine sediment metagenome]|uniref:N-acetyltransferase domain-containing protein n=1 Tax=marine sediment metagenome TaxID=412755 RepID=A0A0F9QG30_9ZZZZ
MITDKTSIKYKNIALIPTIPDHLPFLWEILQGYPNYFADDMKIKTWEDFIDLSQNVKDSLTVTRDGITVGCIYLDNAFDDFAEINILIKRRTVMPTLTPTLSRKTLKYFFIKHNLKMIIGVIRENNHAAINLMNIAGGIVTDYLPKCEKVGGLWYNCVYTSILREAVI